MSSLAGMRKSPSVVAPTSGSEHYYTFDTVDYSSLTQRNQVSGLYDLTIQQTSMKDINTNITGTADIICNGTTDYASISSMTTGTSGITIAFWFSSNSTGTNLRVFDFGNGAANNNIELYLDINLKPVFSIYIGATQYTYTATNFIDVTMKTDSTFRHIGIVMNPNGTFQYYLNGGLYNTTTGNQYPNAVTRTSNFIGKGNNAPSAYLSGGVGEFRIYNGIKTDVDMLAYYKSNTRIDNYTNMFYHYKFLAADLTLNGTTPKIKNYATNTYDMTFNRTTLITITDPNVAATSGNVGLASQGSKFTNSTYLYSYSPSNTTADNNYGANLPAINTPVSGTGNGFTICFWFKLVATPVQWGQLFGMNTQNGKDSANQAIRIGIHVNTTPAGNPIVAAYNNNSVANFPAATTSPTALGSTWHFYYIKVDYTAQTVVHYIDMNIPLITGISGATNINANTVYNYVRLLCAPAFDVPAYAQIDDFRFYKIPLTLTEIRAIYTKTNKL